MKMFRLCEGCEECKECSTFFDVVYLSRFSGYLGYQKSGIKIAPFDKSSLFWEVTW